MDKKSQLFKLSPSDFKYLWEECKHCYYRKVNSGIYQPSIGIPSIFTRMSGLLQKNVQGTLTTDVHPDLPPGKFVLEEGWLESHPLPSGKSYIKGRFDLITQIDDGSHGIIDIKITNARDEDLHKFDRQLHAYKYALENPADDTEPLEVTKLGLLIVAPTDVRPHNGFVYYKSKPVWKEIEINMPKFFGFIDEVEKLLSGDIPAMSESCDWCKFRK